MCSCCLNCRACCTTRCSRGRRSRQRLLAALLEDRRRSNRIWRRVGALAVGFVAGAAAIVRGVRADPGSSTLRPEARSGRRAGNP